MNNFNQDSILYYPTIEFQSETWLKSALTFWDKVYRIVPTGYTPLDSDEIYIAKQEGLIEDINLTSLDLEKTAKKFEIFCDKCNFLPSGLDASLFEVRLHSDKIDERLKPFFSQFSKSIDREGFYKIPERIANGYMFFLSDTVSKRRNIAKLTDNPDMFVAMSFFDAEGDFDEWYTNEEATDIYTTLIIENLIPADMRSISITKIIELNKNLSKYKKEFRKSVSVFNDNLSKIEDKEFAIKEIVKFRSEISEININRTEVLKTFINFLKPSLLYVGVPVFTGSLIGSIFTAKEEIFSIMGGLSQGILLGGFASLYSTGSEIRKRWTSERSNYYLDLKHHLTSTNNVSIKLTNMADSLEEFIND